MHLPKSLPSYQPWSLCGNLRASPSGPPSTVRLALPQNKHWRADSGERACCVTLRRLHGYRKEVRGELNRFNIGGVTRSRQNSVLTPMRWGELMSRRVCFALALAAGSLLTGRAALGAAEPSKIFLHENWQIQSSCEVKASGAEISAAGFDTNASAEKASLVLADASWLPFES